MTDLVTASSTRTVDRALALLAEVCDHEQVTLAQCARSTRLPASTALRLLRTLEARSFVRRDEDGSFHAGPRMIQLGATTFGRQALATLAEPALRRIVAECGETTYLLIAGPPGSALTIGMVEGTFSVRHTSWIGHRIAVGHCAIGRVLAGALSGEPNGESAGAPDSAGYIGTATPGEPDVTVVAAPIERPLLDASIRARRVQSESHAVVGTIAVVGPTYRLDDERVRAIGSVVSRESRALANAFASMESPPPAAIPPQSHESEVQTG